MNKLVFKNNDQVVTSSRNIARDFGKKHQHVLRDIDNLKGDVQNWTDLFYETTYIHEQNKQEYRQYLMNRDGFTLLVMGFTGRKAMQFKMKYINAFNVMEKQLTKPKTQLEVLQMTVNELTTHDKRITNLEESMRIDGVQEHRISALGKKAVIKALGGYKSPAYQEMAKKVFARFWRDFKNHFLLPRYSELPRVQYDEAIEFIKVWQPDTSTRLEIQAINNQQRLKVVTN